MNYCWMRRTWLAGMMGLALAGAAAAQTVPRPSGEFTVHMLDGSQVLLSSLRGKVVLIEFVFTTCPHCQVTSALTARLYQEYGARGLQPVGVAFDDAAALGLPQFIRANRVNYPMGLAPRDSVLDFLKYTSTARLTVPQIVFIDRKGVVRAQSAIGGDDHFSEEKNLRAHIEKLLAEPGASRPATKKPAGASKKKGTS